MSPPPSPPGEPGGSASRIRPSGRRPAAGDHRLAGPGSGGGHAGGRRGRRRLSGERARPALYVIDVEPSGRPTITPMKATLRKDGTIGKAARRYDASRLYWTETPKFVRRVDERILRQDRLPRGSIRRPSTAPAGRAGAGRGSRSPRDDRRHLGEDHGGSVHGRTLDDGGPREGRLVWSTDEDGRQRLRRGGRGWSGARRSCHRAPRLCRSAGGAFGLLAFEAPPRLALALLAAPDIPPEAAGAVAEAFGALAAAPPPPRRMRSETRHGIAPTPVLRLLGLTARQRRGRWNAIGTPFVLPALRLDFDYPAAASCVPSPTTTRRFRDRDVVVTLERELALEALGCTTALAPAARSRSTNWST